MKRIVCLIASVVLALSLTACSGGEVSTAKSDELKSQYSFYEKSVKEIRQEMKVTPEQADEIFLVLVNNCGLDGAIRSIYTTDNGATYSYYWEGSAKTQEITLEDGVVSKVNFFSEVLYPIEQTTEFLDTQAVENVTKLIDNLNDESTYEECVIAKNAFNELSKKLKKQIPDSLISKLEYKTIVLSENLPQYYGSYKEAQTFCKQFEKGIVSTDSYSFDSDVTILSINGYLHSDDIYGIGLDFKNAGVSLDFEEAQDIMNKFLPTETISRYYDEPVQELHTPSDKNESSYITTCYSLNEDGKKTSELDGQIGIVYEIKNNVCLCANIGFGSPTRGLNVSDGYSVTSYPPNKSTDSIQTTPEITIISEPETSEVEYPTSSVSESVQTDLNSAAYAENSDNTKNHFNDYDTPEQQNTAQIVLNTSTKKYHYSRCSEVNKIKPENYATISSESEAIAQGYTACKRCH